MTSVIIGNSVTNIGYSAFYGCTDLTSVIIGNSVTSIGNSAFQGCIGLKEIHISNIEKWCNIKFSNKESNPLYQAHHIYINNVEVTNLVIPNSVTNIGEYAFYGCNGLTSVSIPPSVTSIGKSAFFECVGLKKVYITNIEAWCNISFSDFESNPLKYAHSLYINNTQLTDLLIPNSVTSIKQYAFFGCNGLTSVTIPNSTKIIDDYAFLGCENLTNITIPNSVLRIGFQAFSGCISVTSIIIAKSVTRIEDYAFAFCPKLTDVYCLAENVPRTNEDAFTDSFIEYATLHVPASAIESYRIMAPWNSFKSIVATDGSEPPTPEVKKCATPTIAYVNGKLKFTCETEGAEFVSEVTVADAKKYYDAEVSLLGVYHVTAYAMKTGYDNSDVASADFVIKGSTVTLVGDVNNDNKVDATDITKLIDILLKR